MPWSGNASDNVRTINDAIEAASKARGRHGGTLPGGGLVQLPDGVFKVDGQLVAWHNECPHRSGPVCQGRIYKRVIEPIAGDGTVRELAYDENVTNIVCSWHGYEFDLKTGANQGYDKIKLRKAARKSRRSIDSFGQRASALGQSSAAILVPTEIGPEAGGASALAIGERRLKFITKHGSDRSLETRRNAQCRQDRRSVAPARTGAIHARRRAHKTRAAARRARASRSRRRGSLGQ